MTQLSLKAGLKEWGYRASTAARSKMKQLHLQNTFTPKQLRELSQFQRHTLLESHIFLKQKSDGKIKGRTVAGGNKQCDYISKEDASHPPSPRRQCFWHASLTPRKGAMSQW
jgi:hypothetical protein